MTHYALSPARFAPVAPIQVLEEMCAKDPKRLFGDYHLLLAHHTVAFPERFTALFKSFLSRHMGYQPATIIMDNSIVELGGAVDDQMISDAVCIIQRAEAGVSIGQERRLRVIPVLPDVMGDGPQTRELSHEAYERWQKKDMPHGGGYMLVAQGGSFKDFCRTIDYFFMEGWQGDFSAITWVGIPRVLVRDVGTREAAVRYVRMVAPHLKIHLLGFSDDMFDDFNCARMDGVSGIDSAVPIRINYPLTPSAPVASRNPKWFEEGILSESAIENCMAVRKWIDNGKSRA